MKLKKAEIKTCRVAYLYHDGHCILMHAKRDKDAGKVEWVTIYENIGIEVNFDKPGRLIIDPAVLPFITVAKYIRVSTERAGSEYTRKHGIQTECIELRSGVVDTPWFIINFPGMISSDIYFNDNCTSTFKDIASPHTWGMVSIKAIYREKE